MAPIPANCQKSEDSLTLHDQRPRGSTIAATLLSAPLSVAASLTSPISALRILLVEDHAFQRAVAADMLRALGAVQIVEAENGTDALDRLTAQSFDVVFCDIAMPQLNGPGLMAELARRGDRAFAATAPAWVWMTAQDADILDSHQRLAEALGLRAVHALRKPLEPAELAGILAEAAHGDGARPDAATPDDATLLAAVPDGFHIVLQPQFALATGRLAGAEALCRWRHPTLGNVPPDRFIGRLEMLDAADPILFLAIKACLAMHRRLRAAGLEIVLGVNASARTLCRPETLPKLDAMVAAAGLPRRLLVIELTEELPVPDPVALSVALNQLRLLGYGVAIDDFGVGIATLKLLADLPFTQIKLDRSFVRHVEGEDQRTAICRHVIALARDLGRECVAEGVETVSQRAALAALGCDLGQGYLWSAPLAPDDFLAAAPAWAGLTAPPGTDISRKSE
ncbi:Sensor histidine kinase RcsC [Cupriavidus campinensis]|nr:Sensor histidine kinase RcsC [Cupriavidus campinensis]